MLNNTLYEVISNNTAPVIEPGEWVYAVASYNGTTIDLFINGAPAGSLSASGIITTSFDAHVYIGAKKYESAQFRGVLDEVRIAGVARTASWVMNAYTNFSTLIGNMSAYSISTQVAYFGDYVVERSNYVEEEYVEQSYEAFAEGRIVTDANGNISPSFYITDHLGSTRAVITPDNGGTLVEAVAYSSYGNMHLLVTPAEKTREKFTTKEFDEDGKVNGAGGIRLNYFPARYYDPEIGMFIGTDAAGQFWNSYRYTTNPINSVDPNGLWEVNDDMVVTVGNENGDPTGYCPDGQPFTTLLDPMTTVTKDMQVSMGMDLPTVTNDIPSNSIFRWIYAAFESPSGGKMDFASNGKLTSDLYVINGKTNDIFEAGNYAWGYAMNKLGFSYSSTWAGSNAFGSVRANYGAWGLSFGDNYYDQKAINAGYNFKQ